MTSSNESIVVGVDGSESAAEAFRWAADEAVRRHFQLRNARSSWCDLTKNTDLAAAARHPPIPTGATCPTGTGVGMM